MGGLSPIHWLLVIAVILLLFGSGKVSTLMGDVAKGIKSFKKNMAEDHDVSMAADADRLTAPTPTVTAERETTTVPRR